MTLESEPEPWDCLVFVCQWFGAVAKCGVPVELEERVELSLEVAVRFVASNVNFVVLKGNPELSVQQLHVEFSANDTDVVASFVDGN